MSDDLIHRLRAGLASYAPERVYLFGSRARGAGDSAPCERESGRRGLFDGLRKDAVKSGEGPPGFHAFIRSEIGIRAEGSEVQEEFLLPVLLDVKNLYKSNKAPIAMIVKKR